MGRCFATSARMDTRRKAILTGALAGLAGTLAMNVAQRMWTAAVGDHPPESAAGPHDARDWQERDEGRNSNEMAAQWLASRAVIV